MHGHPNKHIREAVEYALDAGWTLRMSRARAHTWGLLFCRQRDRSGCRGQSILRRAIPKTTRTTFVGPLNAARIEDKIEEGMKKYHFSLVVSDQVELTESVADALYSAGCDDATPGMCEGVFTLDFHRDATSLEEAIRTAIENVRRAGLRTTRVEIDAAVVGPAA